MHRKKKVQMESFTALFPFCGLGAGASGFLYAWRSATAGRRTITWRGRRQAT